MIKNTNRIGHFTSSKVGRLMMTPAKRSTYIDEVRMERKLKRPLDIDTTARPLSWGNLVEGYVFDKKLGLEYKLTSSDVIKHPTIEWWSGSPDGMRENCVMDIKCPMTMKSFCQLSEMTIDTFKKEEPEYYWQLVSNAILLGVEYAELIVFCPEYEDLPNIIHKAQNIDSPEQYKYYWIAQANYDELPYLTPESEYKSLFKLEFKVPEQDKTDLTNAIIQANQSIC
jgi:hypothetical protein